MLLSEAQMLLSGYLPATTAAQRVKEQQSVNVIHAIAQPITYRTLSIRPTA